MRRQLSLLLPVLLSLLAPLRPIPLLLLLLLVTALLLQRWWQPLLLHLHVLLCILLLCLQLLQGKGLLQLLRCADTQHLNPVHRTHGLTTVVAVKQQQQKAHTRALRQREGLRAALVLGSEAAQQLPRV
jgi:hypothetical protein